ncbi:hypothetical protein ITJ44_15635 [Clavibacter sp. VKM Ac-2873]|uniref:hypothetical protein n=1 Tax=Clavibacter sp. VKM Ac-2873 TaxID=2783813 RepID=UPI00188B5857|nr:hypothetical protein [Clavibacter sp. VKM Ac-2873]MBF4619507.1 hypothetical protein [Clavibacter sp. VKM Ac-2873]
MVNSLNITPSRVLALVALGIPSTFLISVPAGNMSHGSGAGVLVAAVLVVGILVAFHRMASRVETRTGHASLPWKTYAAVTIGTWALLAALVFAGAQFQSADATGTGAYTVWAIGSAFVGLSALVTGAVLGSVALRQSLKIGSSHQDA